MSKKLDLVNNVIPWLDNLKKFKSEEDGYICPLCNSKEVTEEHYFNKEGVGTIIFTCNSCDKSAHFCRVEIERFKNGKR